MGSNNEILKILFGIKGADKIPDEVLEALGPDVTLKDFLAEMKKNGLRVSIKGKKKFHLPHLAESADADADVHLVSEVADTSENRERYAELKEEAQENMVDTGIIQSFLETGEEDSSHAPIDLNALAILDSAAYEGKFDELPELAKNLKKDH